MLPYDEVEIRKQAELDGITHFATGIAVFRNGKLLVVHRVENDDFLPGQWELPGGGVDDGEEVLKGAKRELFEETGLATDQQMSTFPGFDYSTPTKPRVRQVNFKIDIPGVSVKLEPNEHDDYKFITQAEIDNLKTNDVMRKCLYDAFA